MKSTTFEAQKRVKITMVECLKHEMKNCLFEGVMGGSITTEKKRFFGWKDFIKE